MSHLVSATLLRDAAALLIVKATILLALAATIAVVATRFSAARRHMVWLVTLASCVGLVLLSPLVPAMMIHVPVAARHAATVSAPPIAPGPPLPGRPMVEHVSRVSHHSTDFGGVRGVSLHPLPAPSRPLVAIWIVGCIVLLVRHAIGFAGTLRLARRATIAHDDATTRDLARLTAAVGVRRRVRIGYSTDVRTPMTFDVVTPYVLLPTDAQWWSSERRRAVLIHEAAHIARRDWLSQGVGRLACALFWFHPLVWYAFARLRDEAERAADDAVLRSGMPACEYAAHLLALVRRTMPSSPDLVAIGIVSPNNLERRFVAMFDATRSRAIATRRARAMTTGVALAFVCPLASLRVGDATHPMRPGPTRVTAPHAVPLSVSAPQYASHPRPALFPPESVIVAHLPELRLATVRVHAPELPPLSIASREHPTPRQGAHPDLSGKWTEDTVTGPMVDFFVTDSTIITQSARTISFESRGHMLDEPTYGHVPSVSFDGTESSGVTMTGASRVNLVARAAWAGDTLVLTSFASFYNGVGAHELLTIERMTLSADGNTLLNENLSYADTRVRWGGPHTFVLRRMAP